MLINRVEIHELGIKLDMNLDGLDDLILQLAAYVELWEKETFIPLNMNLRKGQRAPYNKSSDNITLIPLVRLLAMGHIYEQRLQENLGISQREFCELHNIPLQYLHWILQLNLLSPTIKQKIINGLMPKQTSIQDMLTEEILRNEQEKWVVWLASFKKRHIKGKLY